MTDDLRPNLVGGLLGLQQGLIDDHSQIQHNNSESKFMSLQDNHNRYENRLLGLSQDSRNSSLSALAGSSNLNLPNGNDSSTKSSIQRKCSSTPEDFNSLYASAIDNQHHHTPAHTPPNRLNDHNSITGELWWRFTDLKFGEKINVGTCQLRYLMVCLWKVRRVQREKKTSVHLRRQKSRTWIHDTSLSAQRLNPLLIIQAFVNNKAESTKNPFAHVEPSIYRDNCTPTICSFWAIVRRVERTRVVSFLFFYLLHLNTDSLMFDLDPLIFGVPVNCNRIM